MYIEIMKLMGDFMKYIKKIGKIFTSKWRTGFIITIIATMILAIFMMT